MASERMSTDVKVPSTAADWLIELYAAEPVDHLLPKFTAWLKQRPQNLQEFNQLEAIYLALGDIELSTLRGVNGSSQAATVQGAAPSSGRRQTSSVWKAVVTLTVVMLVLGVGAYASGFLSKWGKLSNGEYSAEYGTVRSLDLVDNSLITLNGGSQITLDVRPDHRFVTLNRGEALFRVQHDSSHPFEVKVGSWTVQAVGTVFSVRKSSPEVAETVVQEGSVVVRGGKVPAYPVSAGQTARIENGGVQLESPEASKVDARLSWTAGLLSFNGEHLSEVVKDFNRSNRRKLAVDATAADQPIGGLYPSNSPDGFANAIELTLGIQHSLVRNSDGTETLLLSRGGSVPSQGSHHPHAESQDRGAGSSAVVGNRVEEKN
jgi:transmembrane sensor